MTLVCILHDNGKVVLIIKHLFEPEQVAQCIFKSIS